MLDCDGVPGFVGSRYAYARHLEGGGFDGLQSGARRRPPLPENKLVVLRDVMRHPYTYASQVDKRIDANAIARLSELIAMKYIEMDHRFVSKARLLITQSGIDAMNREPIPIGATAQAQYDKYVPPCAGYVRAGGEDALNIKSKGVE